MTPRQNPKPYLILIHGLRGDHHGLLNIAKELQEDFQVLTPDLPGSGDTPELSDKTLDGYAQWLHQYCTRLPAKPYIVGHSMGSIVVSHFASQFPADTAQKIVLMAPIFRSKAAAQSSKILYGTLEAVLAPLPTSTKHKVMASRHVSYIISHFLTFDKLKQKEIDEQHYKYSGRFASPQSLLADAKISMTKTAIIPEGKETLLCIGTHDQLTKADFVRIIASHNGAKYEEIADVGHLINYERPAEVATVIKNFLL